MTNPLTQAPEPVTADRSDPAVSLPGKDSHPTRLLLMRHGAGEGAEKGRFFGRTDVELSSRGEAQMREAAARVAPWLGGNGDIRWFTSPLRRARRSGLVLRETLGLEPPGECEVVEGLAELDLGKWEGETHASLSGKEAERLKAHYADFVRSRPPGGESLQDLALRVRRVLRRLRERVAGKSILVMGHAGVNRVILCDALGVPLENFFRIEQDFAALNIIEYHGERPLVRLMNG